jgi:hypothetical protein
MLRDYHADLPLVNTPTIQKVISTGRLLIQLNRRQISARRGIVISGASGTGKTTALTQFGRAHELAVRKRHPDDRTRLPVIYVTVPPAATSRMLAVEFARFLGLEFTSRYNLTDVTNAVCSVAAHTHVGLVLVDEIHSAPRGAGNRRRCKTFSPGCRSSSVGAERSPSREAPGRAGSSADKAETVRYCQTVRVRQARSDGIRTGISGKAP